MAYPIEPFSFDYVQSELASPLFEGSRDKMGKHPSLLEKTNHRLIKGLKEVHIANGGVNGTSYCVDKWGWRRFIQDSFQAIVTVRANPPLARFFAFRADARQK